MTPTDESLAFLEPDVIDSSAHRIDTPGVAIALAASRCVACGRTDFPKRDRCTACAGASEAYSLQSSAKLGARTSVLHQPPGGLVEVPYEIGVAEFPEGIAVLGLLLAGDAAARGDDLQVVTTAVGDRLTYAFRPIAQPTD